MTNSVIAIDPGNVKSALVVWDGERIQLTRHCPNDDIVRYLHDWQHSGYPLAIEQVKSYGKPIGDTVLDTVLWSGRFIEAYGSSNVYRIPRKEVVAHLCGNARSGDSDVRQAIINRFGGKDRAIGTKASPGPLHGVVNDLWAALAVALTWWDSRVYRQTAMRVNKS